MPVLVGGQVWLPTGSIWLRAACVGSGMNADAAGIDP
jgi:hypothetical protein